MDFKGKDLNGYYTVREKLGEDLFAEIWEVKPIFSALELYGFFFKNPVADFQKPSIESLERYVRETYNLQHANLVNVFESDTYQGRVFIITERVPGFRLADYLATKESFPLGECLSIVYEILSALVYLHRRGLSQNLINPQTVWIAPHLPFQSRIRIACFGFQFVMGEAFLTTEQGYQSVVAYLAPEVRQGPDKTADFQSDLYSVGVILFRLLTGELPEKIGGPEHRPMPVKQAETVLKAKGVPREVRRLVVLLMKIRTMNRVQSAEAIIEAVMAAIRRYTFKVHGEIDARAYLDGISRGKDPPPSGGPSWSPHAVYGTRSAETAEVEGGAQADRNAYFIQVVEEYMNSKTRQSLEWSSFPAEAPSGEPSLPASAFIDETRENPADPDEVHPLGELLPVNEGSVQEPSSIAEASPQRSAWGPLVEFFRRLWGKLTGKSR